MKEEMKKPKPKQTPQKKFDLQRERPNVMVSVANALQAANVLVNSMRVSFSNSCSGPFGYERLKGERGGGGGQRHGS